MYKKLPGSFGKVAQGRFEKNAEGLFGKVAQWQFENEAEGSFGNVAQIATVSPTPPHHAGLRKQSTYRRFPSGPYV